ncbi:hypothetical protein SAMN05421505_104132 [Sinosporangium album]|uniref:Uncharacterized protein n=1 Tax=Sinosporangium album TaxID=504805 RepID=A0A1G7U7G9_9ACTN|nr:hypothetical protein [Sinosporangium album]SDG43403.1 hypothetical protein SAMN05421505_104132 [Sinosporangium album]
MALTLTAAAPALGSTAPPAAPALGSSSPPPADDRPRPTKPVGNAINPRPVPWTSAKVTSKGRAITLVWWSGVAPCTVLDRVKVKRTPKRVIVTLYEGAAQNAASMSCIALAVQKTTTVKLKHPVGKRKVVDGARLRAPR